MAVIVGTSEKDNLLGTAQRDGIYGRQGNDIIDSGAGEDIIYGDLGDDSAFGGAGTDYIFGGIGNDNLNGGEGGDILFGGLDDDILQGNAGNDRLFGNDGNDCLSGGSDSNTLSGGQGADVFVFPLDGGTFTLENADIVTDFGIGLDILELDDGRKIPSQGLPQIDLNALVGFNDFNIFQGGGNNAADAIIQNKNGKFLAILQNVTVIPLSNTPPPTPEVPPPTPAVPPPTPAVPPPTPTVPPPTPAVPPPTNLPPTDILLSNNSITENSSSGALIGDLFTTDPNGTDTHIYTLLNDAGSRFQISGNQLLVNNSTLLDFETGSAAAIIVRTTDQGGLFFDKTFTITIVNVNEAPIAVGDTFTTTNILLGTPLADSLSATIGAPLEIQFSALLANDSDPDGNPINFLTANNPVNGSLTINSTSNSLVFSPNVTGPSVGSFDYTITDGALTGAAPGTVTIQPLTVINGLAGNDTIVGSGAADSLIGNDDNDSILGGAGNDTIRGGEAGFLSDGDDVLFGEDGDDLIDAGEGFANQLEGGAGNDTLVSGDGNDTMVGDTGNDSLVGNNGNDSFEGGDGIDELTGGLGVDLFYYDLPTDGGAAIGVTTPTGEVITDFDTSNDFIEINSFNFLFTIGPFPRTLNPGEYGEAADLATAETSLFANPGILAIPSASGTNVDVYYDSNGSIFGGQTFLTTLVGQTLGSIDSTDFFLL